MDIADVKDQLVTESNQLKEQNELLVFQQQQELAEAKREYEKKIEYMKANYTIFRNHQYNLDRLESIDETLNDEKKLCAVADEKVKNLKSEIVSCIGTLKRTKTEWGSEKLINCPALNEKKLANFMLKHFPGREFEFGMNEKLKQLWIKLKKTDDEMKNYKPRQKKLVKLAKKTK
jgi:hypothetical protein